MASSATDQLKTFATELEGIARKNPLGALAGAPCGRHRNRPDCTRPSLMLPEVMRLLGVDLNLKFAEIRAQAEDLRATTIRAVAGQVRETSLMVGFAVIGAIAALATLVIVFIALYRWVDMYHGPFAALAAVGVVTALLAGVMFMLAFGRRGRKPASAAAHRPPSASAPPSPPPALSSLPSDASLFDILTHRFSTRLAGASDDAIDAAVHIMRTGSRSALFGTLAVVVLVGRRP